MQGERRYKTLNSFMKNTFGESVFRISVDGGFTCPVRDGTKGWKGCAFCNVRSFTPPSATRLKTVREQVIDGIERIRRYRKARKFAVYFQPYTNTYADVSRLRKIYTEALESHPDVVGLFIGTRPDCLPDDVIDLLDELNKRTFLVVELGLQTANDRTLETVKRGHTVGDYIAATEKLHTRKIKTLAHVIIGLPGDSEEDFVRTARLISDLGVFAVKIHPLHVVKHTELEKWYLEGKYIPMYLQDYVRYVGMFLENLSDSVLVARLSGESPDEFLVAPDWCRDKFRVIQAIELYLERMNIYQGMRYRSVSTDQPERID